MYIDTSALVAYYCPESASQAAERHLRRANPPVISFLTEVEFCSALAIKTRTGDLSVDDAKRVLGQLREHCDANYYRIVPIAAGEYAQAIRWLGEFNTALRTVDALHLAVAAINDLPVLTADLVMVESARQLNIPCTRIG